MEASSLITLYKANDELKTLCDTLLSQLETLKGGK